MRKIPVFLLALFFLFGLTSKVLAGRPRNLGDFTGSPPIRIEKEMLSSPVGLTPDKIKKIYSLPKTGGNGTIAIIDAYDYPSAENDLNIFSQQFGLPLCDLKNKCFEKHKMSSKIKSDTGWETEEALDIEWAHAIAPKAKILLIEALSPSGINLRKAILYATKKADVVAVSMSWGGPEFETETAYDNLFISKYKMTFFASSGDNGNGVSWPAVSPNVTSVGGTSLTFATNGDLKKETAWSGSGGGISTLEKEPDFQLNFKIPKANKMRAVPDVSYNADPKSGYAVYTTAGRVSNRGWLVVGGTSASSPQWAGIRALSKEGFDNAILYLKDLNNFKDILSGKNGNCKYYCQARAGFDYITGLGSPQGLF